MSFPLAPNVGDSYVAPNGIEYKFTSKGSWKKLNAAIPGPATPEEIAAGVVANKYISPATFPFIRVNTTLNVPGDYPTIAAALTYLNAFRIPADVNVTIQLGQGTFAAPVDCPGHPDSNQIVLQGAPMLGAMPVDADFTMSVAGTGAQTSGGCNTDRANAEAMLRNRFATVVTFLNGGGFKFRGGRGFGTLRQLLILGGGAATDNGISVSYGSFLSIDRVSVHDCKAGIQMIRGGQIEVVDNGLTVSGCREDGVRVYSQSSFGAQGTVLFGNIGNGLTVANNGFANISNGACRGNLNNGMSSSVAGAVAAYGAKFERNGGKGVNASDNATVTMNNGGARNNGATDVAAQAGGFISASNPLYGGSTYSPAINQQGSSANGYAVIAS